MNPSIGRIVRYRDHYSQPRAALITHVHDEKTVDLAVFYQVDLSFERMCKFDESGLTVGSWWWPELR